MPLDPILAGHLTFILADQIYTRNRDDVRLFERIPLDIENALTIDRRKFFIQIITTFQRHVPMHNKHHIPKST